MHGALKVREPSRGKQRTFKRVIRRSGRERLSEVKRDQRATARRGQQGGEWLETSCTRRSSRAQVRRVIVQGAIL